MQVITPDTNINFDSENNFETKTSRSNKSKEIRTSTVRYPPVSLYQCHPRKQASASGTPHRRDIGLT